MKPNKTKENKVIFKGTIGELKRIAEPYFEEEIKERINNFAEKIDNMRFYLFLDGSLDEETTIRKLKDKILLEMK